MIFKSGFVLGFLIGLSGLQLLLYSTFHIEWTKELVIAPWIILTLFLFFEGKRNFSFPAKNINNIDPFVLILALLLFLNIVLISFESILLPIPAWDGFSSWFLGAKAFFIDGKFNTEYIVYAGNSTPPFLSLFVTWIYIIVGSIQDRLVLLIYPAVLISILCLLFSLLRPYFSLRVTLFSLFLFTTIQNVVRHAGKADVGNADFPLSYFLLGTFVLLTMYIQKKKNIMLVLMSLFGGVGCLVKSDGIPFFLMTLIIATYFVIKNKNKKDIFLLLPGVILAGSWVVFSMYNHLPQNPFITGLIHIQRTKEVILSIISELINISRWNLLWILFVVTIPLNVSFINKKIALLLTLLSLGVYFVIYLMTPLDPVSHIQNSFDRLLLQITPIAFVSIMFSIHDIVKTYFYANNNNSHQKRRK